VTYLSISTDAELRDYCRELAGADLIAFDTEFVSEDSYRPHLCLIQVAAAGRLAVIDTLTIDDLGPFWETLAAPGHETVVHAGREELRFALQATGRRPHRLFDVQIAAGLVGLEYPAAYRTLVTRLLGQNVPKGETRTDWRRRPLSQRQIDYALQDVVHLKDVRDELQTRLERLERRAWLDEEMQAWQDRIEQAESEERWQRVSGISGLSRRSLAIARELWRWREAEAESRNQPPRRVLRDDLLVELARRQTADRKRIQAVRGLERRHLQRSMPEIAERIERALQLPEDALPSRGRRQGRPPFVLLGQFLAAALSAICRSADLAPALVGTAEDVRELVAYHLGVDGTGKRRGERSREEHLPALGRGWRAEVVGNRINELLDGRIALRVDRPLADQPLGFVPLDRPAKSQDDR
jgi:ribonuclease D